MIKKEKRKPIICCFIYLLARDKKPPKRSQKNGIET